MSDKAVPDKAMSDKDTVLRAGVVGAGSGGMLSIKALQGSDRYELVGVADISENARAKAVGEGVRAEMFANAATLLETVRPDVICISTFAPSHAEVLGQALEAGVQGVLLEKPIALDWASARAALDSLELRRVPVVVPHGLLVRPASTQVLYHVSDGDIGADVINAGVHWLDFALAALWGDDVQKVLATFDVSTRTFRDGVEVETEGVTYAVTRNGVRIVMQTGDDVRPARDGKDLVYRLYGDRGSIEFWGWEDRYSLRTGASDGTDAPITAVSPLATSAHQVYLEMLADMMAKGEPQYELAELSLRALEICDAAYLSHRHRCAVPLPLSSFVPPPLEDWDPGAPYHGRVGRDGRRLK
jgi:predicted dehydrogenase